MLRIVPLIKDLKLPVKAYIGDAGWDVFANESVILNPGDVHKFNLGFAIIGQKGKMYRVEGKSGLATKWGVDTIGNVIDNGYRGEVSAILSHQGKAGFEIKKGEKIAQIVIYQVDDDDDLVVKESIAPHFRNNNGFGSSGK